jgi:hypothetical protein
MKNLVEKAPQMKISLRMRIRSLRVKKPADKAIHMKIILRIRPHR